MLVGTMLLRLVEFLVSAERRADVEELVEAAGAIDSWRHEASDGRIAVRLLVEQGDAEALIDRVESRLGAAPGFRLVMSGADVTLPAPREPESPPPSEEPQPEFGWKRLSRQELLGQVTGAAAFDRTRAALILLSVVVAATGLLADDVAVVIAAMVIAPLLGPNTALAFATTTGDAQLARRALATNLAGLSLALGLSLLLGAFVPDKLLVVSGPGGAPTQIGMRVDPDLGSGFVVALAAGAAGALSFTSGASGALVGVMVAVALMPPLLVVGMMIAKGLWQGALGSGLLLATNVICVNLAAVATFSLQGVRPARWWEADRATRATRRAFAIWGGLLLALIGLIWARSALSAAS